jgi:hypothetical protein
MNKTTYERITQGDKKYIFSNLNITTKHISKTINIFLIYYIDFLGADSGAGEVRTAGWQQGAPHPGRNVYKLDRA